MLHLIAAMIVSAFARRFAGGLLGQWLGRQIPGGTTAARGIQAVMIGALAWWLAPSGAPLWHAAVAGLAIFVGSTAGFPPCGMIPTSAEHVGGISQQHGVPALLPLAVLGALAGGNPIGLVLVAYLTGPIYWLAALWQPRCPVLGLNRDGLPDPPAWAEYLFGAARGAAIFVLLRTPL